MDQFGSEIRAALTANRANWNSRVPVHVGPDGYRLDRLVDDPMALSDVVDFDRRYLGDLTGQDALHLQCHIGTDTISLARLGATVTGLDFSEAAIDAAADLAERCGVKAEFVLADLYRAPSLVARTFDLVYTGVGAIPWLPDIQAWASVVAEMLRPGGRFHMTEGHPMALVFADDATPEHLRIDYPYFEGRPAMRFEDSASYIGSGTIESPESFEWAHNLGAIVQALIDAGLIIDRLEEHRELAWPFLPWMEPVPDREGWYRLPESLRHSIPLMFTLQARKRT
ncbi:MAG: class I SAM-dependent methyltransferase [Actinomycetota bacterium]